MIRSSVNGSAWRIEFETRLLRLHQVRRTTSEPHSHTVGTRTGIQFEGEGPGLSVVGVTNDCICASKGWLMICMKDRSVDVAVGSGPHPRSMELPMLIRSEKGIRNFKDAANQSQ